MYQYTGPWRIISILDGASYGLQHFSSPNRKDKKHATDLSPYPDQLIPFQPVGGAGNHFGQLCKPIRENPFKEAGICGFEPSQPFKVLSNCLRVGDCHDFTGMLFLSSTMASIRFLGRTMKNAYITWPMTKLSPTQSCTLALRQHLLCRLQ